MKKKKTSSLNRRDTLKSLLLGGVAFTTFTKCNAPTETETDIPISLKNGGYGRTESEEKHDQMLSNQPSFFTENEAELLVVLVDLIIPADDISGSATDAGVMGFLDFIVKDMVYHQMPLRQGLAWLERKSIELYNAPFTNLSESEQFAILDLIAYPEDVKPENKPGEAFFSRLRNLTLTGFYTSKIGIEDIGYQGNRPNFWNGVPSEVLQAHGLEYDEKYQSLYVDESTRSELAEWDEDGNLI